mgnify:CR=1 FL=1
MIWKKVLGAVLGVYLALITGCTAQQWQATQAILAATALVGVAVIVQSNAVYTPVTTCESRCTLWGCWTECVTR